MSESHLRGAAVIDDVGEEQLQAARRRLFEMVGRADDARDRGDVGATDRWELEVSRARIGLCEVMGDDRLAGHWASWHRQRWPGVPPAPAAGRSAGAL